MKKKKVIIIGAGPAGLSTAYELLKNSNDYDVTIVEESNSIGGISKTVNHNGNRMDLGGHRFFTKIDRVNNFWNEIMPIQGKDSFDDKILKRKKTLSPNGPDPEKESTVRLVRQRVSRIYYLKKFFDYPVSLKKSTIKSMGMKNFILCGFSYLKTLFIKKKEDSLENFYINRFGKKLYSMFFEKYTYKLWGRHPKNISADWGAQRVKGLSIIEVLKNALNISKKQETSLIDEFTYPKYGPGSLWEEVANKITEMNGKILLNHKVTKITKKDTIIKSIECTNNENIIKLSGDIFISSMPIKDLITSIDTKVPNKVMSTAKNLPYRDFVTIGILVKKLNLKNETNIPTLNNIVPDCWIYVQEDNVKMGRIQVFNNWSPYMVNKPKDTVWLGLEYFCDEGDSFWNKNNNELKDYATEELIKMGIINNDKVLDFHVEKVKKAYPAYFDSYKDIDVVKKYIDKIDNLYCVGRNGQHRYNNMDHSVMTGFLTADYLLGKIDNKNDIWNVNTEKTYHEEKNNNEKEVKKNTVDKVFKYLLFICFLITTLYISIKHEPWRDEAQSWLMSRDMSIIELIKNASSEGHPILWHIVLKIFILCGLSYNNINLLSWILTSIGAYFIIWKFSSNKLTKISILMTYPLLYFCPSYARSYSLLLPIFIVVASMYKDRIKHPYIYGTLILLLCNIHLIFTFIVGLLFLVDIYDYLKLKDNKKSRIIILVFTLIGFITFLLQLFKSNSSYYKFSITNFIGAIYLTVFESYSSIFIISLITILTVLFIKSLFKNKEYRMIFIYFGSIAILLYINTLISNIYMIELYVLILIFIFWNIKSNDKVKIIFMLIILLRIPFTITSIRNDIIYKASDSENTAQYIMKNIPKNTKICCKNTAVCSSIIPYINKNDYKFIDIKTNKTFTYINWKEFYKYERNDGANTVNCDYYILIKNEKINNIEEYKSIYKTKEITLTKEEYNILEKNK